MAELLTYLTRLHEVPRYYGAGLYRQLYKKNIFLWSQAIAFKVLITIVPVIILATGVMGQVLQREKPFDTVATFVQNFLPADQSEQLIVFLRRFSSAGDFYTIIGVLALLFSALTLFTTLRVAVGNVFQEEWHEDRSILGGYLFDLRMVGQVGVLFLLTIALTIGIQFINRVVFGFVEWPGLVSLWNWSIQMLLLLVPFLVTTAMFFQLFYLVPKPRPPKRSAVVGALFSAILWEGAKSGFTLYAEYVGRFDRYGEGVGLGIGSTFGLIIAFVFWVYYSGIVLCLGAIIALLHEKRHRSRRLAAVEEVKAEEIEAEESQTEASTTKGTVPEALVPEAVSVGKGVPVVPEKPPPALNGIAGADKDVAPADTTPHPSEDLPVQ